MVLPFLCKTLSHPNLYHLLHLSTGREGLAHLPYKLSKARCFKGKAVSQGELQGVMLIIRPVQGVLWKEFCWLFTINSGIK